HRRGGVRGPVTEGPAMTDTRAARRVGAPQAMILPLALAQFIASYAATNMNVAISTIATDLGTTVAGMQTTITLFTLTMAALMIPGSKVTEIWGRKRCFVIGLIVYGIGALLAALGLFFVVLGILQTSTYGWFGSREDFSIGGTVLIPKGGISPMWLFVGVGAVILAWFFWHIRSRERHGREPLLPLRLFRN